MNVELQRRAKVLDEADGGTLPLNAELAPSVPLVGEEGPQEEIEDIGAEPDIPRQVPADALGEGQRPLAERHVGEHAFHQVDGGVMRPASVAGRAHATALAGEGNQHLVPAGFAPDASEALGQDSAGQVLKKFLPEGDASSPMPVTNR